MRSLRLITIIAALAVAHITHAASVPSPSYRGISDSASQGTSARATSGAPTATLDSHLSSVSGVKSLERRETTASTRIVTTVTAAAVLPSTAPEYSSYSLFTSAVLNSTNVFRREHNATVATWNTTLAKFADDYLVSDKNCTFAHSGGPYGENLAVGYKSVHGAIDGWGNERNEYNFKNPGFTEETGHFSQLVWKTSVTVGCGRRLCGGKAQGEESTGWFLVCEYWPRGNIIEQFADQVQKQVAVVTSSNSSGNSSIIPLVDEYGNRPSSGVIIGSMVILLIITAAFVVDIQITIKDRD